MQCRILRICVDLSADKSDSTGIPLSATWARICFAFAGCLQSALIRSGSDTLDREEEPDFDHDADPAAALQADPRAVLILQLLLAGLQGPTPSLTHLLMGFDVTRGPDGKDCLLTVDYAGLTKFAVESAAFMVCLSCTTVCLSWTLTTAFSLMVIMVDMVHALTQSLQHPLICEQFCELLQTSAKKLQSVCIAADHLPVHVSV